MTAQRATDATPLTPQPTAWDCRVLNALREDSAHRVDEVVRAIALPTSRTTLRGDVLRALRGLEHLGYATHRNGWWRRAEARHGA